MEFSRQEYWSGLPFLPPGDLPNPGLESRSPALQADSLPSEPPATVFDNCNPKQLAYCLYPRSIINCWRKALTLDFLSVQFSSVAQSCPTLCDPKNRSTPGLPVHHQLPDFFFFFSSVSPVPTNMCIFHLCLPHIFLSPFLSSIHPSFHLSMCPFVHPSFLQSAGPL